MGKTYIRGSYFTNLENTQNKALAQAKKKGADAVLFKDYYVPVTNTGINAAVRYDSASKMAYAVTQPAPSAELIILYLKYR